MVVEIIGDFPRDLIPEKIKFIPWGTKLIPMGFDSQGI